MFYSPITMIENYRSILLMISIVLFECKSEHLGQRTFSFGSRLSSFQSFTPRTSFKNPASFDSSRRLIDVNRFETAGGSYKISKDFYFKKRNRQPFSVFRSGKSLKLEDAATDNLITSSISTSTDETEIVTSESKPKSSSTFTTTDSSVKVFSRSWPQSSSSFELTSNNSIKSSIFREMSTTSRSKSTTTDSADFVTFRPRPQSSVATLELTKVNIKSSTVGEESRRTSSASSARDSSRIVSSIELPHSFSASSEQLKDGGTSLTTTTSSSTTKFLEIVTSRPQQPSSLKLSDLPSKDIKSSRKGEERSKSRVNIFSTERRESLLRTVSNVPTITLGPVTFKQSLLTTRSTSPTDINDDLELPNIVTFNNNRNSEYLDFNDQDSDTSFTVVGNIVDKKQSEEIIDFHNLEDGSIRNMETSKPLLLSEGSSVVTDIGVSDNPNQGNDDNLVVAKDEVLSFELNQNFEEVDENKQEKSRDADQSIANKVIGMVKDTMNGGINKIMAMFISGTEVSKEANNPENFKATLEDSRTVSKLTVTPTTPPLTEGKESGGIDSKSKESEKSTDFRRNQLRVDIRAGETSSVLNLGSSSILAPEEEKIVVVNEVGLTEDAIVKDENIMKEMDDMMTEMLLDDSSNDNTATNSHDPSASR